MQANRAIPRLPLVTSSCSIGNDTRYRPYNRTANCLCTIMLGEITKTPFSVHRRENKNQRENRVSQELNVYNREREREREKERGKKKTNQNSTILDLTAANFQLKTISWRS